MIDEAVREHDPVAVFALFSGGHDSLCALELAAQHPRFTAAAHLRTGVGIPETLDYVRRVCADRGIPLLEYEPDAKTYRDLVIEKGMPQGPKAHATTYYYLKQRQIRRLVREHKRDRSDRVLLVTGIRSSESTRRLSSGISVPIRREGAQVWVNPILAWSKRDCHSLMEERSLPRNPVVDLLHRSGECLCGALARRSEFAEVAQWFPETAARLREFEQLAREHGHNEDAWGNGGRRVNRSQLRLDLELCSSCEEAA